MPVPSSSGARRYSRRPASRVHATPVATPVEMALGRIVRAALDELKRPDAIPSRVLMAALLQARAVR